MQLKHLCMPVTEYTDYMTKEHINSILASPYSRFISFLPAPTVFLVQQTRQQQKMIPHHKASTRLFIPRLE